MCMARFFAQDLMISQPQSARNFPVDKICQWSNLKKRETYYLIPALESKTLLAMLFNVSLHKLDQM